MIAIRATVRNSADGHAVRVETNGRAQELAVGARATGRGSRVNGGELLFAAIATCYVNDLFREAAGRGIAVAAVTVECAGEFGDAPGSVAEGITYEATVEAAAPEAEILALMRHTDGVAEVHNTLRRGTEVVLARATGVDTRGR
jgi:uncharacterized OsmC-like protein